MNWPEVALGEIATFRNGLNYTKDNEGTGLRIINVKDFGDRLIPDYDALGELNPHGILRREALLEDGDVIFVRSNGNKDLVGRSLYIMNPPDNISFSAFCIRARFNDKSVSRFYSCFFRTPHFRKRLALLGRGTNISNLNQQVLNNLKVPRPANAAMSRIVGFIGHYDDLIENNRRRIQLLEQAARLLYKEWFVHLRFPGHEHVKITNGVPEGWSVLRLSELATKIGSGATPRGGASSYQSDGITLIRSMNVYDYRFDDEGLAYINDEQADKLSAVTVEPLDILLNITGASVGRCCIIPSRHIPARVNQHVMIIRIDRSKCSPHFVLHAINSHETKQALLNIARAGGATREALTKEVVSSTSLMIPTKHLVEEFEAIAAQLFEQCQILESQNCRLVKARDLLLPRLMNGEIKV